MKQGEGNVNLLGNGLGNCPLNYSKIFMRKWEKKWSTICNNAEMAIC